MQLKSKYITPVILLGVIGYLLILARGSGDFFIYLSASKDLFAGKDIYSVDYIDGYYYMYSVLFAILIYPLTLIPLYLAQFIWLALNTFFLYRIIKISASYFSTNTLSQKQKWLLLVLGLVFALRFILANLRYMQITICILYLALEGVQLIFTEKKIWGALLIALGINIKILPIVILPYLIYRREWKASFFLVLFYGAMSVLPALLIGFERNSELVTSWWNHINPMNSQQILDVDERSFHGLSTLLATLLVAKVPDIHALPIKRNIADLSVPQLTMALNIVRLLLVSFSLYFFRTKPFKAQSDDLHRYWEVSYLLLLIPLIFPHQQHYAFLFIAPAMCYVFYYIITYNKRISSLKRNLLIVSVILIYLAANLGFILGVFNQYYEHFKILTYGALLLIPTLAACVPKPASVAESRE